MAAIYCKKCGLRGDSKCPHCRSVFADRNPNEVARWEQEALERLLMVRSIENTTTQKGESRFIVGVWTYATDSQEALKKGLDRLNYALNTQGVNLKVAACIHDWELMPGVESSIGCGHKGPDGSVPEDPFASK